MTDAPQWFYADGSEEKGPLPVEEMHLLIAVGTITADTPVWSSKLPERVPLRLSPLAAGPAELAPDAPIVPPALSPEGWVDLFVAAVRTCFSRYATFTGRAPRAEYWFFVLFCVLVSLVIAIFEGTVSEGASNYLSVFFSLGVFLPSLAVQVRRLHDTDRSGWWAALALVPVIGSLVLVWFCVQPGTKGRNRFG